jgi:hypothetical protein
LRARRCATRRSSRVPCALAARAAG